MSITFAVALSVAPATAVGAEVTISSSPDPIVEKAMTVGVSGSADGGAASLYVFVMNAVVPCAATHGQQRGYTAYNRAIYPPRAVSGSFGASLTFTPEAARGYRVCAYVGSSYIDDTSGDQAMGTHDFTARAPAAPSITVTTSPAQTVQGRPLTVKVTASSEVPRDLGVVATTEGSPGCAGPAVGIGGGSFVGTITRSYTYVPPYTSDTEFVCATVSRSNGPFATSRTKLASAVTPFAVRPPPRPRLDKLRLRLTSKRGFNRRRPGATLVSIDRTPGAAPVTLTVRRRGRRLARANFDPGDNPLVRGPVSEETFDEDTSSLDVEDPARRSFVYRWRCDRGGKTSFEIRAVDDYGRVLRRRRVVRLPSCGRLRAIWRQERAEERAQQRAEERAERRAAAFRRNCRRRGGRVVRLDGQQRCLRHQVVVLIIFL